MKKKSPEEQKFENDVKKLKIQAEFGASMFENPEANLPPEVESKWLDSIIAFEKAAEKKEVKKIREVLSFPELPAPENLDSTQITNALGSAIELLNQKGIEVSSIYDVPDKEMYRFICEDLMEVDMNIIDSPGWITTFTYEEFYPNHEEDLKRDVREFVESMLKGKPGQMEWKLESPFSYNNREYSNSEFIDLAERFGNGRRFSLIEMTIDTLTISELKGHVSAQLEYQEHNQETKKTKLSFEFVNEYDWWMIIKVSFPPIDISF